MPPTTMLIRDKTDYHINFYITIIYYYYDYFSLPSAFLGRVMWLVKRHKSSSSSSSSSNSNSSSSENSSS